ncbi:RNA polymerase sigma-70 factor [Bacteroidales bacterium OttesenSCG-928-K03]|nr:RNA polymerase sigma-70 factor [Odoribacter sp. OttesenSCG-928-L07]MDL2239254.1 RNA polymerase sigma-70 factor [Bacteroidales bacterium OttesenSCG-928-L14]MDL2240405.1 RNA polymerase sigma-70 factor [Bacteroidales bacterium OttesenSCG-928-K22]MDL2242380.1 RNA polymerase sigma-70 factor [Bacteroidales bacterium OttesenSCG-928-K03]
MENIDIIKKLREGNHNAFEMIFKEWYSALCEYAFSILQNDDDTQDVVQKFFCKFWDKREQIEIHTSIKSYLYRSIHNDCMNVIKQRKTRADYINYSVQEIDINYTDNNIITNELNVNIQNAIEKLPPRCKEVFLLSRINNLSYSEISRTMDISVGTVETQMVKALKFLRNELKDYLYLMVIWSVLNQML